MQMTTRTKRNIAFIFTLLVTVSLVTFIDYYSFNAFYTLAKKKETELCERTIGEEAAKINERITSGIDTVRTTGIFLASSMKHGGTNKDIYDFLSGITANYRESAASDFTGVYGLFRGEYIDGADWIPDEDYDARKRPWYWAAVHENGLPTVVTPYLDAETGNMVISVSMLLEDGESVLALDIKAERIQAIIEEMKTPDSYGLFVNSNGVVIFGDDPLCNGLNIKTEGGQKRFGKEKADIVNKVIEKASDESGENYLIEKIEGRSVMVFSQNILDDWYLVMVTDYESVFRQEKEVLYMSVLLSLLIIGVVSYFCASVSISRARVEEQAEELQEKAKELKKASTEKSRFLANMSHEIRTPINAVLGMNEMILRESTNETITGYSDNIRSASKTLLSIVNDVLDFSKIEAGEMSIIPVDYSTMTLLRDAYNVVAQRAADKKVELRVFNNTMMPARLMGDETRIRQILTNLLNNAIKYTTEGLVTVEMDFNKEEGSKGRLFISVTDTGIGISDEDKNKLFTSYIRVDQKKNRNIEGTGLGLSITKQLVALMDGRISLESEYGMGSKFSVEIPQTITDDTPMGVFAETPAAGMKRVSGYKESFRAPEAEILVVDDVDMNLEVMKGLLKNTKVKITTATNGVDCIDLAKQNHYDIIFMDHLMPDMDGIETFKRLKSVKDCINAETPVIVLTANAVAGAKEEYIKEGFADYLSKPVQGNTLEEMVRRFLPKEKIEWEEEEMERTEFVQAPIDFTRRTGTFEVGITEKERDSEAPSQNTLAVSENKYADSYAGSGASVTFKADKSNTKDTVRRLRAALKAHYFSDDLDMTEKMINVGVLVLVICGLFATFGSWMVGNNSTVVSAILGNCFLGVIYYIIVYFKKNTVAVSNMMLFTVIDILFPIIFFNCGGIRSGMPLWFAFGLLLPWMLTKGVSPYILYTITLVEYMGVIVISEMHPELVTGQIGDKELVADILIGLTAVTAFCGIFLRYQTKAYVKQRKELLSRTQELDESLTELEKANNAKTDFLTNMSHEIRTPIHAILGYSEMIGEKTKEPATAEYISNVEQAGRNLLAVVSDILDYTGIGGSDFEIEFVRAETFPSIIDILSYAQYNAGKKNLAVAFNINPNIPMAIKGDSMRFTQVCTNLISNAVKYTEQGSITIDIDFVPIEKTDKCEITFSVTDTGVGIKPEDMEMIAERYLRVDKSKNRSKQGAGIGLAFTVRILEKMGSELHAESRYGKGSRFWFTIRPHIVDPRPIGDVTFDGELYRCSKEERITLVAPSARILAVDDNAMNLDLIGKLLEETKIKIDYAEDGLEAVDKAKKNHYDLIFMDHMLPVMDGVEALNVLRREHICDDTPIVVNTANAVAGEKKKYLDAGFDEYLSKPVEKQRLLKVLAQFLPVSLLESLVTEKNSGLSSSDRESAIIDEAVREAEREEENRENESELSDEDRVFLERASFLDTKTGMSYCCDDTGFYKKMLRSYMTNSRAEEILKAYEERNFENYRIFVHAVKGTSLTIGATELSEHMKSLEYASRDGDIDFVDQHHEEYLREYKDIISKIDEVLK
jgi:signal transduction histidine kinase/DNA-binding response OmpR family regulator